MTEVKPGAFFDIDGTIFKSSLLEKLVTEGIQQMVFTDEAFLRATQIREQWQKSNNEGTYIAYTDSLVGAFVTSIAGVRVGVVDRLVDTVVREHTARRFRFPQSLMRMTGRSHTNVIISGSPQFAVERYVQDLSPHLVFGSQFEVIDGVYTGGAESVSDKARIRQELITRGKILAGNCIAIGDTMSDKSILSAVDVPIMLNPSSTLANYGRQFGWPMVLEQKDNIVVLQANSAGDYRLTSQTQLFDEIEQKITA